MPDGERHVATAGRWFVEAYAGAWVFTANGDFFRGHVLSQAPLWAFQAHASYNFRPGLWLAADATYYTGGETAGTARAGCGYGPYYAGADQSVSESGHPEAGRSRSNSFHLVKG